MYPYKLSSNSNIVQNFTEALLSQNTAYMQNHSLTTIDEKHY